MTVYRVAFTSSAPEAPAAASTLVVACSAHGLAPALREFLDEGLKLAPGTYDLLAVPGGPHFLMLTSYLPKFAWAGHRWVKFLVEKHTLRRAILVAHEDCAWHNDERMLPALLHRIHGQSGREAQVHELEQMVAAAREALPGIAVEAYFARKEPSGALAFVHVA